MTAAFMILIHHIRPSQLFIVLLMCQNLQAFTLKSLWRGALSFSLGLGCVWERNDTLIIFSATLQQISLWNKNEQRRSRKKGEKALKLHGTFRWIWINSLSSWVRFNMSTWKMERIHPLTSAVNVLILPLKQRLGRLIQGNLMRNLSRRSWPYLFSDTFSLLLQPWLS